MRISDWSSDVCSSDLQFPRACSAQYGYEKQPHPSRASLLITELRAPQDRQAFDQPSAIMRSMTKRREHGGGRDAQRNIELSVAGRDGNHCKDKTTEGATDHTRSEERRVGKECVR